MLEIYEETFFTAISSITKHLAATIPQPPPPVIGHVHIGDAAPHKSLLLTIERHLWNATHGLKNFQETKTNSQKRNNNFHHRDHNYLILLADLKSLLILLKRFIDPFNIKDAKFLANYLEQLSDAEMQLTRIMRKKNINTKNDKIIHETFTAKMQLLAKTIKHFNFDQDFKTVVSLISYSRVLTAWSNYLNNNYKLTLDKYPAHSLLLTSEVDELLSTRKLSQHILSFQELSYQEITDELVKGLFKMQQNPHYSNPYIIKAAMQLQILSKITNSRENNLLAQCYSGRFSTLVTAFIRTHNYIFAKLLYHNPNLTKWDQEYASIGFTTVTMAIDYYLTRGAFLLYNPIKSLIRPSLEPTAVITKIQNGFDPKNDFCSRTSKKDLLFTISYFLVAFMSLGNSPNDTAFSLMLLFAGSIFGKEFGSLFESGTNKLLHNNHSGVSLFFKTHSNRIGHTIGFLLFSMLFFGVKFLLQSSDAAETPEISETIDNKSTVNGMI